MTHSLIGASAATHLRIVVAALVGATLVVAVGIAARVRDEDAHWARVQAPVVKAGHPQAYSSREGHLVR
jgi:hypothetical protein